MPRRTIDEVGELARRLYQERVAAGIFPDAATPSVRPSMPRRRSQVRRRTASVETDPAKREYGEPVFTWAFASSKPRGGTIVTYETRLEEDGQLRCNCMGWVFQRKNPDGSPKPRHCKHIDMIADEWPVILRKWRAGEDLPIMNPEALQQRTTSRPSPEMPDAGTDSRLRHGRVIDF